MKVVGVLNSKGGVGKTTLCVNLARFVAKTSPRVAIVDLDPQKSALAWWQRGGCPDNPTIFRGADTASEAVERLSLTGWDYVFLDGPPAFLEVLRDAIEVSDVVVIPFRPSMVDIMATQDAVVLSRQAQAAMIAVLNDVHHSDVALANRARESLRKKGLQIADTVVSHQQAFITAMTDGKAAEDMRSGKKAAAEIEALWSEIECRIQSRATRRAEGVALQ